MADNLYWVWLAESIGAASKAYAPLLERFGTPYDIYRADEEDFYKIPGVDERVIERLCDKNLDAPGKIIDYCTKNGIGILTYDNERFPQRLREIRNSPVLLYYRGKLPDFDRRLCIAVVGTRKMTEYGEQSAYKISYELASAGAVVVSGMALGVDGIASCAAVEAGGVSCAVLGCGIDVVYPPEHKRLMDNILKHGAVLTEFSPGTPPERYHFPMRNRIISGLCQGTLVVEADAKSGALITANEALYQGRDLYALPGNIDGVNSTGTNKLLKEGAKIVTSAEDIIGDHEFLYSDSISYERLHGARDYSAYDAHAVERMGVSSRRSIIIRKNKNADEDDLEAPILKNGKKEKIKKKNTGILKSKKEADLSMLGELERKIFEVMPDDVAISVDLLTRSGLTVSDVMTSLTLLEINGFISALPGGLYIKR